MKNVKRTRRNGDVSEEVRNIDERDTEESDTLDSSEKTIAIQGDRWWPQAANQEGDTISKKFLM